ncbi:MULTISPECIES: hypothetical protein [unclassified Streptomyces]|uniref:hypothetical protein n=1 Tax=unclassified Streptomyces TaxID=2593676 RepID=UPI0004C2A862|nr:MULTISPECIES: hypothetical protein [unclassified Streptomyces]
MEESATSTPLRGAVRDLTTAVVSALRSGGPARPYLRTGQGEAALAAVRVLGADALLPSVLLGTPPAPEDLATFRDALKAYPPPPGAGAASVWSHRAMARTLHRFDPGLPELPEPAAEPGTDGLHAAPWQSLTHQLAVLAPLAVPGADCPVARVARGRPVDVARGFVRAVRRRDWPQAAGAGRWLTLLDGVPDTLGLEPGLRFVAQMAGEDPRVTLHLEAARLLRTRAAA